MRPFIYEQATTVQDAVRLGTTRNREAHVRAPAQFIGGGTVLLDLMKIDVMRPEKLVAIKTLADQALRDITVTAQGARLGALVSMSQAADHEAIKRHYPVMSESLAQAASAQLRNMATLGGNVLQRTRCSYFRDVTYHDCNKRNPGAGCAALGGVNRLHAVLGVSDACIASYPGDWAQALIALDARVEITGPRGNRTIAFADLHKDYATEPHVETTLASGELITAFTVPAGPNTRRSTYLKIRDRESYAFALTSAAVALDLDGDRVRDVRIALGGVASKPWRAREVEDALRGQPLNEDTAKRAAKAAFANAKTHEHNAFKVPLGEETIVRALLKARDMEV